MKELIKCLVFTVFVLLSVGCENNYGPFEPNMNELYGYEFDCGLAKKVDYKEQTFIVNENAIDGVPNGDCEWNLVRISAYVGPNDNKKYVSYEYNENTSAYHYDWCTFIVEKKDRRHRQLKVFVAENKTSKSRAVVVEFRKRSSSGLKTYKGEFSIIQSSKGLDENNGEQVSRITVK